MLKFIPIVLLSFGVISHLTLASNLDGREDLPKHLSNILYDFLSFDNDETPKKIKYVKCKTPVITKADIETLKRALKQMCTQKLIPESHECLVEQANFHLDELFGKPILFNRKINLSLNSQDNMEALKEYLAFIWEFKEIYKISIASITNDGEFKNKVDIDKIQQTYDRYYISHLEKPFECLRKFTNRFLEIAFVSNWTRKEDINVCHESKTIRSVTFAQGLKLGIKKGTDSYQITFGFIPDKRGFVPIVYEINQPITTIHHLLWGSWPNGLPVVLIENNKIMHETGILLNPHVDGNIEICPHLGINHETSFINPKHTIKVPPFSPLIKILQGILGKKLYENNHLIRVPSEETDLKVFVVQLLNGMLRKIEKDECSSNEMNYIKAITGRPENTNVKEGLDDIKKDLEEAIDEIEKELLLEIRKEQDKITKKVIANTVPGRSRGRRINKRRPRKKRGGRGQIEAVKSTNTKAECDEQKRTALLEKFKVTSDQKFSNFMGIVNNVMKTVDPKQLMTLNTTGSHNVLHLKGCENTVTIVKQHGKKTGQKVPRGRVNDIIRGIIDMAFNHSSFNTG